MSFLVCVCVCVRLCKGTWEVCVIYFWNMNMEAYGYGMTFTGLPPWFPSSQKGADINNYRPGRAAALASVCPTGRGLPVLLNRREHAG